MRKNFPRFFKFLRTGLILVVFLFFGFNGFGQSIGKPNITNAPVCGGSTIEVNLTLTNGPGNGNDNKRFKTSTTYSVFILTNGNVTEVFTNLKPDKIPVNNAKTTVEATLSIPISNIYDTRSDYQIRVVSSQPESDSGISDQFEIKTKPNAPTASNNGPVCEGNVLQLTATNVAGATYTWNGPNNFTSDDQNPVISNATASVNGTYTVTAMVNGCTSDVASTNVLINPNPTITGTKLGSRCGPGTVSLGATASAGTINWYAAPSGGSSLATGTTFTTPSISSNITYFVDATLNDCTTGTRTAVLATVNTIPTAPTASNNSPICVEGKLKLTASDIPGASYSWTGPDGFASNQQNPEVPNMTAAKAGTYTVTSTLNGCSSAGASTIVIVNNVFIWTGAENNNWNNTNNWSCNRLPTLEIDVLIPENLASGNYPKISTGNNALAKNMVIENNASVLIDDNWLRISGNLTNAGILNTQNGSISFEGLSAQIIPNSAFENNRIQNLQINNTYGVTSETTIEITGILKVEAGSFDTGNDLTLISDENQTALIDGIGNGEVIGLVNVQRYLDKAFGYKYFSSPFQNSVVGDFAPYMDFQDPVTAFPHFYRYDENRNVSINDIVRDATGWEPYIETENSLNTAEGYALNFGASTGSQTIELIGEVNNGSIPARQLENNHRIYTRGFHLVGNPYPSPINWNAAQGWTRNNIDNGIYFFTASENSQYTGTYTAYVNDISTGDPQADGRSSNIIPSMQGFFIKVSDSDSQNKVTGSFGMDNRVRVTDFEQEFLRTQLTQQKALIRLEAGFNTAKLKDPMVIYFSSFATPNFEKEMDAHKLMNTDPAVPSFYNITEDQKELAINAIPYPKNAAYKKIPLGIKAEKSGKMKINLTSLENISPNLNIYLIDHNKGIGQNLRKKPDYTFNIEVGTHNSRFELMFSEEKVANPAIAFNELFHVGVRDGEVIVKLNLENNQQGILRASTMTGQILQTKSGGSQDEVIFDGITSDGVYIINLQLGKNQYAKKVIIKK